MICRMRNICSVHGCGRFVAGRGLCMPHWFRLTRYGDIDPDRPIGVRRSGDNHHNWKGGTYRDHEGRIYLLTDDGYMRRARLVAEKKIGRRLKRNEEAHHINEIVDDDRPENIEVLTKAQHALLHSPLRKRNNLGQYGSKPNDTTKKVGLKDGKRHPVGVPRQR